MENIEKDTDHHLLLSKNKAFAISILQRLLYIKINIALLNESVLLNN